MPQFDVLRAHEERLNRLEVDSTELGEQVADHLGEARSWTKTTDERFEFISRTLEVIDAKQDEQAERLTTLATAVAESKTQRSLIKKYWSHALLAALGAAGSLLGKLAMTFLLHR